MGFSQSAPKKSKSSILTLYQLLYVVSISPKFQPLNQFRSRFIIVFVEGVAKICVLPKSIENFPKIGRSAQKKIFFVQKLEN